MNSLSKKKLFRPLYFAAIIIFLIPTLVFVFRLLSPAQESKAEDSEVAIESIVAPYPKTNPLGEQKSSVISVPKALAVDAPDTLNYSELDAETVNPEKVKQMLRELVFDEHGDLVIGSDAKRQLDLAINLIGYERNSNELAKLNEVIHDLLPGRAGEQVTDLLNLYYDYKLVEIEFANSRDASSPADAANNYQILSSMRQSYLGDSLANKLFSEEDKFMKNTHELMQRDNSKSPLEE